MQYSMSRGVKGRFLRQYETGFQKEARNLRLLKWKWDGSTSCHEEVPPLQDGIKHRPQEQQRQSTHLSGEYIPSNGLLVTYN